MKKDVDIVIETYAESVSIHWTSGKLNESISDPFRLSL